VGCKSKLSFDGNNGCFHASWEELGLVSTILGETWEGETGPMQI
jgi:hypothetical protein